MDRPLLTDSGLETWLLFHRHVDLPHFASFPLLDREDGRALLTEYFREHLEVAREAGTAIVLETPTWRANPDWAAQLGYDAAALDRVNRDAVAFLRDLSKDGDVDVIVSGNIGPRGDGYAPAELLSPYDAAAYHRPQIESFRAAGADRVTMLTATHTGEAIGVIRAAEHAGIPVVVAFTVETDGRLSATGQPLHEAIAETDAASDGAALHFGVNCAHPDHFTAALDGGDPKTTERIVLLRANASRMSHAELDEADELDAGDSVELAGLYAELRARHPHLGVLGGCCGTDAHHVRAIAEACVSRPSR